MTEHGTGADPTPSDPTPSDPTSSDPTPSADPGADEAVAAGAAGAVPAQAATVERAGWWDRAWSWWLGEPPATERGRARRRAIRRGITAAMVLVVVGSLLKLPLLIMSPGPTYNVVGDVNGVPMVTITGTTTYPTDGNMDMVTVAERGGSSGGVFLGEALAGWLAPARSIIPRESIYGPDTTGEDVQQRNDQAFALSQSDSIAAAMRELDIETIDEVVVTLVSGGSPADGIVRAGDVVVAVDGTKVTKPAQVGQAVRSHAVGETVVLDVLRRESEDAAPTPKRLEVVTEANPDVDAADPAAAPVPYLGIVVGTQYQPPFDIDFSVENVGGPSAGMMFSLAIIDKLTPGPMNRGGHVAGTGTITPDGIVGPIGGIHQKMIGARRSGAELFLAPEANCADVVGNIPGGLEVVPTATLADSRRIVEAWAKDRDAEFPTCQDVLDRAAEG